MTKVKHDIQLTVDQQQELIEEMELIVGNSLLIVEDDKILQMDSHGHNIHICTVSLHKDGEFSGYRGFKYRRNSDNAVYSDPVTLVKMACNEVMVDEFTRQDGKDWE